MPDEGAPPPAWMDTGRPAGARIMALYYVGLSLAAIAFALFLVSIMFPRVRSASGIDGPEGIDTQCWEIGDPACVERAEVALGLFRTQYPDLSADHIIINDPGDRVCEHEPPGPESWSCPFPITGWTAAPTGPDRAFQQLAGGSCLEGVDIEPDTVIVDQRGPDAATIVASDASTLVHCFAIRPAGEHARTVAGWSADASVPGDRLELNDGGSERGESGMVRSWHHGAAGPGAHRVEVELVDGEVLTATFAHGWYLAWWPGYRRSTEIRALDAGGTLLARIDGTADD